MIQISQIRLKPDSPETALHQAVYKALRLSPKDTCRIEIAKQSIDSRHKPDILYIYSEHVSDILLNGKKPVDFSSFGPCSEAVLFSSDTVLPPSSFTQSNVLDQAAGGTLQMPPHSVLFLRF